MLEMKINLPTWLTFFRAILLPVVFVAFYLPFKGAYFLAGLFFGIACITDWLDGYLARRYDQSSAFGAFLDPVVDKILVSGVCVLVAVKYQVLWITLATILIITREIFISALREWMAGLGKRDLVAVSRLGKWKTGFQMASLIILVGYEPYWLPEIFKLLFLSWFPLVLVELAGKVSLVLCVLLTIYSSYLYLQQAKASFQD